MSVEEIKRFQQNLKDDKDLQKKLVDVGSDIDKIVEFAKSNGYDFSKSEIDALSNRKKSGELSDDDLEKVAGGAVVSVVLGVVI